MAILALANDLQDLRRRLARVIVAETPAGDAVTLEDLKVAGAMTVLLRDAIKPNLVQTIEGGPAFVHAGPFANIAHGNSSVVADRVALKLNDIVCTEGGFASDMGLQKFVDIKCRLSGLRPAAAVIVATIRALKMHGGVGTVVAGQPLDPALLRGGSGGRAPRRREPRASTSPSWPTTASLPSSPSTPSPPTTPRRSRRCARWRWRPAPRTSSLARHFAEGGAGAEDLARAVWAAAQKGAPDFRFLSPDGATLREQIEDIATRVYGADGVDFSLQAEAALDAIERLGYGRVPVCMAKTQSSLSHDPALKGRPRGFRLPIRDARLFAGAGFVTAYCGNMMTMPGLPTQARRRGRRHRRGRPDRRPVLSGRAASGGRARRTAPAAVTHARWPHQPAA